MNQAHAPDGATPDGQMAEPCPAIPMARQLADPVMEVARGHYESANKLFQITAAETTDPAWRELAEALGLMCVKIEGREYQRALMIDELNGQKKALEAEMALRAEGGLLFAVIIAVLCVYFAILYGLAVAGKITDNTKSFMMLGLVVTIFAFSFFYMKRHRRPLREWGFTLKEWALALRLATLTGIPLAAAGILLKWVLTRQPGSAHYGAPLFEPVDLVGLIYYIPIAAIQEITTRGILQTSIQRIVPGRHAFAMAIFLTALIFAITHVYYSTFTMLVTLVASLYFGWLFHRHRTLVGVAAAHYLLGYLYVFLLRLIAW